jgi:probable phosphoglycerate mutase
MSGPTIYLVRHGWTEWNAVRRYQGRLDSPLTDRGRAQAEAYGRLLAAQGLAEPVDCHVSPLGRARATAAIMAKSLALELCTDPRIAEVSLGAWDGMTEYEIEAEYPNLRDGAGRAWYFRAPGGETLEAARARAADWLADIEGVVIAVTHGVIGRIIRGTYLGLSDGATMDLVGAEGGLHVLRAGSEQVLSISQMAPGSHGDSFR